MHTLHPLSEKMENSSIVPDVIDRAPTEFLKISYPSGVNVNIGNSLTPTEVQETPTVSWKEETSALYTLCMTDPDTPDPKTIPEFCHWLVVNIPGSDVRKGEDVAKYLGSAPPQGHGAHRYIFLLYRQAEKISFSDELKSNMRSREGRCRFTARKFSSENKLGDPVAGNFYLAEYNENVPMIQAKLSQIEW